MSPHKFSKKRYAVACLAAILGSMWSSTTLQAKNLYEFELREGDAISDPSDGKNLELTYGSVVPSIQFGNSSYPTAFSASEQAGVWRAVNYWNEVITSNTGNYSTITFVKDSGTSAGGGWSLGSTIAVSSHTVWDPNPNSQIRSSVSNIDSIMIHELAHGQLGITGSPSYMTSTQVRWSSFTTWSNQIYVNGVKAVAGTTYTIPGSNFTFNGTNVMQTWGDVWAGGTAAGIPVVSSLYYSGGGVGSGSSFVHPQSPYGNMNYIYLGASRPFFVEAELAIMQDLGHTIDMRNFFGRSLYQTHTGTITNNDSFNGSGTYGIGLHMVAGGNTVIQNASLISTGEAGAGIRIEWVDNKVTINKKDGSDNDIIVAANGDRGTGVLITHGRGGLDGRPGLSGTPDGRTIDWEGCGTSNAKLVNMGIIQAKGVDGRGVWFNAAVNANSFDNSGTIDAQRSNGVLNTAIHIGGTDKDDGSIVNIAVNTINFMHGTQVLGNIVSTNNLTTGSSTSLVFGRAMNSDGTAVAGSSNTSASMTLTGDINGRFNLQTVGGTTTINGHVNVPASNTVVVDPNTTLQFGSGGTVGSIAHAISNSGTVAFNRSDVFAHSTAITGTGGLTKMGSGVMTLSGASYTGNTTVEAGTLKVNDGSIMNGTAARITVASGTTLDLSGHTATGGLIISANQTLAGLGTVIGHASAITRVDGKIMPGAGALTFDLAGTNSLTLSAGATLDYIFNTLTTSSVISASTVNFESTVTLDKVGGSASFASGTKNDFVLFSNVTLTDFAGTVTEIPFGSNAGSISLGSFFTGLDGTYSISYIGTNIMFSYTMAGEPSGMTIGLAKQRGDFGVAETLNIPTNGSFQNYGTAVSTTVDGSTPVTDLGGNPEVLGTTATISHGNIAGDTVDMAWRTRLDQNHNSEDGHEKYPGSTPPFHYIDGGLWSDVVEISGVASDGSDVFVLEMTYGNDEALAYFRSTGATPVLGWFCDDAADTLNFGFWINAGDTEKFPTAFAGSFEDYLLSYLADENKDLDVTDFDVDRGLGA
ncbi:MAG: autotransporter-associated beta strand repeat-containing protein [Phycisphaerales bacterium]|nr:autotransporter-associated beta strand repeat-containing protein [Phycisphaerales bacterium]